MGNPNAVNATELNEAHFLAMQIWAFLHEPATREQVAAAHVVNASSNSIQAILLEKAQELGFQSERKGLFAKYQASGLRPDYYRPLGGSGIILEVERGKIISNNMDILDLWKCHVCQEADYLFLVVPEFRPTKNGKLQRMLPRIEKRLSTFFEPPNFVNVRALFLIAY